MNTISKTIRLFLDSIGRRSEYEFYLKKFQSDRSPCFALVLPDSDSVMESGDLMAFDLHFLLRLGLCPLVVLFGPDAERDARRLASHGNVALVDSDELAGEEDRVRDMLGRIVCEERIPVVTFPDQAAAEGIPGLAPRLARRIHVLRTAGMLKAPDGEKQFYVYLRRAGQDLDSADRLVVDTARGWLRKDPRLHISISSPLYLLQEMFTVKGRGSIIRPGSDIRHETGWDGVERGRLLGLFSEAFGRDLVDPGVLLEASDLYLETAYRGAVLLEDHPAGKYLSKFAVGTEARGEGLAQELWEAACEPAPRLFWRSRTGNPVNHWYERHASGHHAEGAWTVFWKGVPAEALPSIIRYALDRPSDFKETAG